MASSFLFNCCTVIREIKWFFFSACLTDLRPHCFLNLFRKDQNLLSPVNCWYLLLNQVRRESKDHATLSDIYLNNVIMRFMQISEDSTRLLKKVSMGNTDAIWMIKTVNLFKWWWFGGSVLSQYFLYIHYLKNVDNSQYKIIKCIMQNTFCKIKGSVILPEISKAIFTGLVYLWTHLHSSEHSFIHILLGLYVILCLFVYLSSELNILFSCSSDVCAQPEEVKCDWSLINKNRGLNSPLT